MAELGRNDPCPCGSGKKYKKCCLGEQQSADTAESDFRFEAGAYRDSNGFVPSIACLGQMPDGKWNGLFMLINPKQCVPGEEMALRISSGDLDQAFELKDQGGSDDDVAMALKQRGYINNPDFNPMVSTYPDAQVH